MKSREKAGVKAEDDQEEEASSSEDENEDEGDSAYDRVVAQVQRQIKEAYRENKTGIF